MDAEFFGAPVRHFRRRCRRFRVEGRAPAPEKIVTKPDLPGNPGVRMPSRAWRARPRQMIKTSTATTPRVVRDRRVQRLTARRSDTRHAGDTRVAPPQALARVDGGIAQRATAVDAVVRPRGAATAADAPQRQRTGTRLSERRSNVRDADRRYGQSRPRPQGVESFTPSAICRGAVHDAGYA